MDRDKILFQIKELKIKMGALWDERGRTDSEILEISMQIDDLINLYYRNT